MKFIFLIVWCIWWTFPVICKINSPLKSRVKRNDEDENDEWFVQKLDHFNPIDNTTWKQRYHINFDYYEKGGPVFLFIGGEEEIKHENMYSGAWIHYASDFGALCIQLEHRFYGKSYPTNDLSTANLRFLSVDQVLADTAEFVANIRLKYAIRLTTKWIAFGGSYAGSLAMWMRMNYPKLIHAAISSSGSLISKLEYHEYFEIIEYALTKYHSPECVLQTKYAFQNISISLQSLHGTDTIRKKFKLCRFPNRTYRQEIKFLFYSLAKPFSDAVKYDDYINIDDEDLQFNITTLCKVMVDESLGQSLNRLAEVIRMYDEFNEFSCHENSYLKQIGYLRSTSWETQWGTSEFRQWHYQTCTELGTFETSDLDSDFLGPNFPISFFEQFCTDVFGKTFNLKNLEKGIKKINELNIKLPESRILNVQGSIDPWYKLGVSKAYQNYSTTIIIEGASHCADMNFPLATKPQFQRAYEIIYNVLSVWSKNNSPSKN